MGERNAARAEANSEDRGTVGPLCECGCGERTLRRVKSTHGKYGRIGHFQRFVDGHRPKGDKNPVFAGRKVSSQGYVLLYAPGHPKADRTGYVREHVLVVERALGKHLPSHAVVHHINENKQDNRPENLLVCDRPYHSLLHQRMRAKEACGNPNWGYCQYCKQHDDPENMKYRPRSNQCYHRTCANVMRNKRLRSIA